MVQPRSPLSCCRKLRLFRGTGLVQSCIQAGRSTMFLRIRAFDQGIFIAGRLAEPLRILHTTGSSFNPFFVLLRLVPPSHQPRRESAKPSQKNPHICGRRAQGVRHEHLTSVLWFRVRPMLSLSQAARQLLQAQMQVLQAMTSCHSRCSRRRRSYSLLSWTEAQAWLSS